MKRTSHIPYLTSLILLLGATNLFAQPKTLKDTVVTVIRAFQPTIADAYKINEMPVVKDSVPPVPNLSYYINSKKVYTPFTVEPLKPAKMVGEPLTKLYNSLVKIGGGNYNSFYGEAFYNNGRSKEFSYGAHLKHHSSSADMEGYGFGGNSDNRMELYGKKFFHRQTLGGNLGVSRDLVHYYGFDTSLLKITDNEYTRQHYLNFHGDLSLETHYTDSIHPNYGIKLKYGNLSDLYGTSENNVLVSGDFSGYYEKQLIHVPLNVDYSHLRSNVDTSGSVIIGLAPYISSAGDKWNARIGIGITIEGNQNDKSRFLFYPNIDFNYNVLENIIVPYGGFSGGLKRNSLNSLSDENPFLVPAPILQNTNEKWKVYGGIRGSITKALSYNARTSYGKIEDQYFFVNDYSRIFEKGFNLAYYDVSLWNVHGELQFQHTEKIKLLAKGDYNKYTMPDDTIQPWHRPALQFTLSANYNLKNKIVVTGDVFVMGTRPVYVIEYGQGNYVTSTKDLKSVIDASLGMEYRYSKKLSAFVRLNNLGFSRYYLWNNYPSYKFNFLVGVTAGF